MNIYPCTYTEISKKLYEKIINEIEVKISKSGGNKQ